MPSKSSYSKWLYFYNNNGFFYSAIPDELICSKRFTILDAVWVGFFFLTHSLTRAFTHTEKDTFTKARKSQAC